MTLTLEEFERRAEEMRAAAKRPEGALAPETIKRLRALAKAAEEAVEGDEDSRPSLAPEVKRDNTQIEKELVAFFHLLAERAAMVQPETFRTVLRTELNYEAQGLSVEARKEREMRFLFFFHYLAGRRFRFRNVADTEDRLYVVHTEEQQADTHAFFHSLAVTAAIPTVKVKLHGTVAAAIDVSLHDVFRGMIF